MPHHTNDWDPIPSILNDDAEVARWISSEDSWELRLKWAKKCGAESSDPNRHSQPRLPGSVVGEASMRQVAERGKITKVSVRQLRSEVDLEPSAMSAEL